MVPIATDVTLAAKHAAVDVTLAAKEAAADAAAAIVEPAVAAHSWSLLLQALLPTAMWVATPALQVATPSARMPVHDRMGAVFGPKWLRMFRRPREFLVPPLSRSPICGGAFKASRYQWPPPTSPLIVPNWPASVRFPQNCAGSASKQPERLIPRPIRAPLSNF